ncbi:MAG: hypothetical protein HFJ37_06395 [Clostridia bacterium]|nr:hypothetical protein [Clostridia bacterium]
MVVELIKLMIYSGLIVLISKYILVGTLRKLAENLNLKPKTVGEVAGYATSMPELLTIGASSFNGLASASMINVLSSNVINLVQYIAAISLNKNQKALRNQAIKVDIILVVFTIVIPIALLSFNMDVGKGIIPIFLLLYFFFRFLNGNVHKLYLKKEDEILERQIEEEEKWERGNPKKTIRYTLYLLVSGVLLFVVGNLLGNTLENLCNQFQISQTIIGILLGFITSIPELITFFEAQKHYKKQKSDDILGVVEATNNLLTSNLLNLFVIQSIGILIYAIVK